MKLKLLAAVASVALMSAGLAAQAQDSQKHDQQPASERTQHMGGAAPRAGEAMKNEAPRSAETNRQGASKSAQEAPKAGEPQHNEGQKAAETQRTEAPKAAETQHKEGSKAAETQRNEAPKAAETQHKEGPKSAETQHNEMQRQGEARPGANEPRRAEARDQKNTNPAAGGERREAQRGKGPARVTGKVKMSNEHAERLSETLRRDARPERVNVDVRVGARVPETVVVRPLPADVISLAPEYRGYDYFVDSNDEIVFVSPDTHEIVGTIDYEGRAAAEDATQVSGARPCPAND